MEFEYTRQWYETEYHRGLTDKAEIDPATFHPERDTECLTDLDLSRKHDILVCGCGGGDDTWLMVNKFGLKQTIWGIDWSQPAVDFCNEYFNGQVSAQQGCVSNMPYRSEQFDRILAMDITEHLPGFIYVVFLTEIRRVLKRGGKVAILPGMTLLPEHINLMPLEVTLKHVQRLGFRTPIVRDEWIIAEKP